MSAVKPLLKSSKLANVGYDDDYPWLSLVLPAFVLASLTTIARSATPRPAPPPPATAPAGRRLCGAPPGRRRIYVYTRQSWSRPARDPSARHPSGQGALGEEGPDCQHHEQVAQVERCGHRIPTGSVTQQVAGHGGERRFEIDACRRDPENSAPGGDYYDSPGGTPTTSARRTHGRGGAVRLAST